MAIIRQSIPLFAIPDFRNLGVCLKILSFPFFFLLIFFVALPANTDFIVRFSEMALWVCSATIFAVALLYFLGDFLAHSPNAKAYTLLIVLVVFGLTEFLIFYNHAQVIKHFFSVTIFTLMGMYYFALWQKALSPAETEAKLAALTARIRPHFLFNSLNAAISLISTQPQQAESVLENLATLFRAQLGDHTKPSTLEEEVQLAQDYLSIEQIRMGHNRLKTKWRIKAPSDTLTPSLLLQPLLENAVYHGIEPLRSPGVISTSVIRVRNWVYITISNPLPDKPNMERRKGNNMALQNLSERLTLMFDQDAVLSSEIKDDKYLTKIRIPYRYARVEAVKLYVELKEKRELS